MKTPCSKQLINYDCFPSKTCTQFNTITIIIREHEQEWQPQKGSDTKTPQQAKHGPSSDSLLELDSLTNDCFWALEIGNGKTMKEPN